MHDRQPVRLPERATRELLAEQAAILARAARGVQLHDLLDDLCHLIADPEAGTVCTVLLVEDGRVWHGASPGMPDTFTSAIDGEAIGPDRGSCGTAAHLAQPVVATDIAVDPRWEPWRDVALAHGLRACWSLPVVDEHGTVLATFAAYSSTPRGPGEDEYELLEMAADLASILVSQDRSRERLRAMATSLARANEQLRAADRAKDDFLSMTSHELRTPLTPMVGMLETLQWRWDELDEDRRRTLVDVVTRHSHRMQHLVDDLLTVASVTAGHLLTAPTDVELRSAVEEAVTSLYAEGREIHVEVPDGLVAFVDPRHLQQVLINYLTNAIKYAPTGPIRVQAAAHDGTVEVHVVDEGPGVEPGFVPDLFEPFRQRDSGDRRTSRGTGLGLSVVRALTEANGGHASYRPHEPAGSCFVIALPAGTA